VLVLVLVGVFFGCRENYFSLGKAVELYSN